MIWASSALSLLLLLLALHVASSAKKATGDKLAQIRQLASKSTSNVISLDDETYAYYAVNKPNPYSLIVFLTASHPKFKCAICKSLDREFQLLADTYKRTMKAEGKDQKLFFLRLDYESSSQVFQKYEVNSVPVIFHIGGAGSESGSPDGRDYHILHRDKYQVPSEADAESMASFLRDRAGVSLTIKRSQILAYVMLLLLFAAVAACVRPVINNLDTFFLPLVRYKALWIFVSLGVYTCAISGLIFDIIRNPQMYYVNPQSGHIMFFYPQSGQQFVVEGFIIGFLNLACAGALVFVTVKAPIIKNEQTRTIALTAGIITFAACFQFVKEFYRMKNRWYGS